jgi:HK97 gp10 family phage protein
MPMKGADKHIRRLRKIAGPEVERIAGAVVFEGADTIRAEAFRMVSAGSVSGAQHVASKPGEAPNRDTGDLQAGFETAQTGRLSAEFRSKAPYAGALEFGTSKMAARPHIRPARDKKRGEIRDRMAEQLDILVKRSG